MAYTYKRSLTVDHTLCGSADSSNFTVLVSLSNATLKDVGNGGHVQSSSGYDIVFASDAAGTSLLNWEIEQYDNVNGVLVAWVKLSTVSYTVDTVFYMFYGNSAIVSFQGGATGTAWDGNYLGVYHLNGAGPSVLSSTGSNDGTNHSVTAATGQIDGGGGFASASKQYVHLGTGMNPTALTISAWVKANPATVPSYAGIVARRKTDSSTYFLVDYSSGVLVFYTATSPQSKAGSHTLTNDVWAYVVVAYDSTNGLKMYFDNTNDGTLGAAGALTTAAADMAIGFDINSAGDTRYWNGSIDEARISNVARGADWITTEYNNQFAPGTFISMGAELAATLTARMGDSFFGF